MKANILGIGTEIDSLLSGSVSRVNDWLKENSEALKASGMFSSEEVDSTLSVFKELEEEMDEQSGNCRPCI